MSEKRRRSAYAKAGVDIDAAERLVSRYAEIVKQTRRPEVLADVGPFAGLFQLGRGYRDPVLVASTDGVGTKVKIGALLGRYRGLGHDVVNQSVNDILCVGAQPLFFLDYIGNCGLSDDAKVEIVSGVAEACRDAGCALLGGETADMPGTYAQGDFDLVGFVVGVVERDAVIDGSRPDGRASARIQEGDALLGLPSSGLHTNGFSLVRNVFGVGLGGDAATERAVLNATYAELGGTLGEALLRPHRSYLTELRHLLGPAQPPTSNLQSRIKGVAHITQGGLPGNVPRMLPHDLGARIGRTKWEVPPLFRLIQERGHIAEEEMYRTFNMGVGIVLAVAPGDVEAARSQLPEAFVVGEVVRGKGVEWGT